MGWWVATLLEQNPPLLVSWVVWVIVSIVLHELAHGWAAIRLGDNTPIELGHMTWNPLVHMGGMSLLVFAIVGIAWGAMPINPSRLRGRHAEALVAVAGPAMNLALAIGAILVGSLWIRYASGVGDPLHVNFATFFWAGAWLNLVLMMFNLLPIPPLDGSRILSTYSAGYARFASSPQSGILLLVVFIAIFFYGAGTVIFEPARAVTDAAIGWLVGVLP